MTEDEAKMKWCPFARVGNATGCNRYPMEHDAYKAEAFAKCIASACMAWRATDNEAVTKGAPAHPHPIYKAAGYCGLAGEP